MPGSERVPLVGVTACLKQGEHSFFHSVQDKYVDAVIQGAGVLPVLLPAIAEAQRVELLLERLDGILVTGSPSNVDPSLYGGPAPRQGNQADRRRDDTVLPLLRGALEKDVPVLAICRGIQELNVALGGTLHQHVQELCGRRDHRSDKTRPYAERYGPAHPISLTPGGLLQRLLGGPQTIEVNSLHGQGIDRLAQGLVVEAVAEDGTIEAVSAPAASFLLGVQWHPEWRVLENPWSTRLFAAFGEAAAARAAQRTTHGQIRAVA
ncbi:gamma-glutamyl-gamma-aminobutyrate hydrolase family protein [Geminicoccaceae bacterium 1502E]|nr:gamma-glutamyl-gamma-aminobutyrate hydrolase family protein [Geminicoccaceae bacterium 1502E]